MGDGGICKLMGRGWCQTHREHPEMMARSKEWPQSTHVLDCLQGGCPGVAPGLWPLWKPLAVFCL